MKPANRRWYRDGALEAALKANADARLDPNVICYPPPGHFVPTVVRGRLVAPARMPPREAMLKRGSA